MAFGKWAATSSSQEYVQLDFKVNIDDLYSDLVYDDDMLADTKSEIVN